ncbi:hypothetical protein GQX73_g8957 [Xylaria multiplex]|uniref:Protein kinase domain-containing protein n=1 Tax=Xylaria multiplex TaxID=323545 RepID=A0A7C8ILQ4_9PEZI|nr:hypothetical protein GQX73_g8957 [Xylaria multiplex]
MKKWSKISFEAFLGKQWIFFAPVFKKHNLQQFKREFSNETILPFTWKDPKPLSGHFSDVFHAKLHVAHQDEYDPNGTEHLEVALKELKNDLYEGTDYNAENSWRLEVAALKELSELKDNHLIHPIAAFKWRRTHYIVFPWANGGTLRNLLDTAREAHLDLNRQLIGEFLEQLCGLAGALRKLHGTNTQTDTALAEADMKNSTSPKNSSRPLNLKPKAEMTTLPEGSPRKATPLNRASSDTDDILKIIPPSEDGDSDVKHWRHGDLKPENILIFKDSTRLGTLKIADLGLAKQHQFATEFRYRVTSTKFATLNYEAPEAVTNMNEPRSRRYDIWSMGCIILESIIWLLYGSQGLHKFYDENKRARGHAQQAFYFTTSSSVTENGSELVASVSEIATHWITGILEKDPECKRYTALRQLLELVRSRLLVVAIPSRSKPKEGPYRATAGELYREVENIRRTANQDDEYLFTGASRRNVKAPSFFSAPNEITTELETAPSQDHLGVRNSLAHDSSQHQMRSQHNFEYTALFLKVNSAKIWKVKGGLADRNGGTPALSIYRMPSVKASSDKQAPGIPIGLPKLADISSQTYFEILRQWLENCDNNHTCLPKPKEGSITRMPTRLIDVEEKGQQYVHLLETQHSQISQVQYLRYIALSHPWGNTDNLSHYCTTRENIAHHKAAIDIDVLPRTFKDAIHTTRKLGVRYLWIDSLCIVQGEGGDFEEEVKYMETVFSSAYCVIAATCASGMFSGFLNSREEREVVELERPGDSPLYVCEFIDDFQGDVIDGPLNKRGWVLQERALARRTIYFAKKQTYWECGEGVRCETLARMKKPFFSNQAAFLGDPEFPKVAAGSPKGGQIRLYELLYTRYSTLQFTKSCDRPLAIAGLEQRLIRAFKTDGGYGVFARYFGRGLLWQRDVASAPQVMKPIQFPKSQKYKVPSWSWMAYEGAITFMDLPFREIEWEEKEVRSPWSPPSPVLSSSSRLDHGSNAVWHTTNITEKIDLIVVARDFSASADNYIVYDRGERPTDQVVKCVVVGRRKMKAEVDDGRIHYVLVVAQKRGAGYERIGVGSIPGSLITLEGPGIQVRVF